MKKFLSIVLSLCIILTAFSVLPAAFTARERDEAEVGDTYTSGFYEYNYLGNNQVEITKYNGTAIKLKIPSTLDGYTVTIIGKESFKSNSTLESVTIPEGISIIGDYAFASCSIKSVVIPNSVTEIGSHSFFSSGLLSVDIPNSVKSIGDCAFNYCQKLESVRFGDSITYIGELAFGNSPFIKVFTLPSTVSMINNKAIGYYSKHYSSNWYYYYSTPSYFVNRYEDIVIKGYAGTDAERYADENGFAFIDLSSSEPDKPTEPETTAPVIPGGKATVTLYDLQGKSETAEFETGDTFTVYTVLNTSDIDGGKIATLSGEQTYDSGILKLVDELDSEKLISDTNAVFPITSDRSMGNCAEKGKIFFSATESNINKPFVFDSDSSKLIVTTYRVIGTGSAAVETKLDILAKNDDNLTRIISGGSVTSDVYDVTLRSSFKDPQIVPYKLGDANGDDESDTIDSTLVQRAATRISVPYEESQMMHADIDGDGVLTVLDATFIQRYATRTKVPYPIGEYVSD